MEKVNYDLTVYSIKAEKTLIKNLVINVELFFYAVVMNILDGGKYENMCSDCHLQSIK